MSEAYIESLQPPLSFQFTIFLGEIIQLLLVFYARCFSTDDSFVFRLFTSQTFQTALQFLLFLDGKADRLLNHQPERHEHVDGEGLVSLTLTRFFIFNVGSSFSICRFFARLLSLDNAHAGLHQFDEERNALVRNRF